MEKDILKAVMYLYASKGRSITDEIATVWVESLKHIDANFVLSAIKNMVYKKIPFPEVADVIDEIKHIIDAEIKANMRDWMTGQNVPAEISKIEKLTENDVKIHYYNKIIYSKINKTNNMILLGGAE